jgi:hypothetical protein
MEIEIKAGDSLSVLLGVFILFMNHGSGREEEEKPTLTHNNIWDETIFHDNMIAFRNSQEDNLITETNPTVLVKFNHQGDGW